MVVRALNGYEYAGIQKKAKGVSGFEGEAGAAVIVGQTALWYLYAFVGGNAKTVPGRARPDALGHVGRGQVFILTITAKMTQGGCVGGLVFETMVDLG